MPRDLFVQQLQTFEVSDDGKQIKSWDTVFDERGKQMNNITVFRFYKRDPVDNRTH